MSLQVTYFPLIVISLLVQLIAGQTTSIQQITRSWPNKQTKFSQASNAALSHVNISPAMNDDFASEHRLVFESYRDGNYEIYTSDANALNTKRITNNTESDHDPALNVGGVDIVYMRGESQASTFHITDKDANRNSELSGSVGYAHPSWSPTSSQVAFMINHDAMEDIFVSDVSIAAHTMTAPHCLTCGSAVDNFGPTWSPDGRQIAFIRRNPNALTGAIWRMNADGSGLVPLTGELWYLSDVRWSPNGTNIAFDFATSRQGWLRIGILKLSTNAITTIYNPNADLVDAWVGDWSPTGEFIFFTRVEYVLQNSTLYINHTWIERIRADGTQRTRLPGNTGFDAVPRIRQRDISAPQSALVGINSYTRIAESIPTPKISDEGGSGIATLAVQMRDLSANSDWVTYDKSQIVLGHPYALRSQAVDREGNVEAPNVNGDGSTIFYTWLLTGTVTDNRGFMLRPLQATVNPTVASTEQLITHNSLQWRLTTENEQSFSLSKAAFTSITATAIHIFTDSKFTTYLEPLSTALSDDFDKAIPDHWTLRGTFPPIQSVPSGNLGTAGLETTLSKSQGTVMPTLNYQDGRYFVDHANITHWLKTYDYNVTYANSSSDWPLMPRTVLTSSQVTILYEMPDEHGGFFIFFGAPSTSVFACHIPDGQSACSIKALDQAAFAPTVSGVVDTGGTAHVVWSNPLFIRYAQKTQQGDWSQSEVIGAGVRPRIVADTNGALHVIYRSDWDWMYTTRSPAGLWSAPAKVMTESPQCGYQPFMAGTPNGTLHLFLDLCGVFSHFTKPYTSTLWIQLPNVPTDSLSQQRIYQMGVDADNNIYLGYDTPSALAARFSNAGSWQNLILPDNEITTLQVDGRIFLQRDYPNQQRVRFQYDPAKLNSYESPSLSTTQFVSASLHRLTLAFLYRVRGYDPTLSRINLEVKGNTDVNTSTLSLNTSDWKLFSLALDKFAGQNITISISTTVKDDISDRFLDIDDFSIAEWKSPVVSTVSLSQIAAYAEAQPIVITGTNFISPVQVSLNGSLALTSITYISQTKVTAALPSQLAPGIYDLWVSNVEGQTSILLGAIQVGQSRYLPSVLR